MTEKMQFEPPQPAETFFEALHKQGQRIDPDSPIIWIEHPPKSGRWIVALPVVDDLDTERKNDSE